MFAKFRGSIVGLHAQFIGTGYAVSNWIGFAVYYAEGEFTVSLVRHVQAEAVT